MKKQIARSMDIDRIPVQRLTALLETLTLKHSARGLADLLEKAEVNDLSYREFLLTLLEREIWSIFYKSPILRKLLKTELFVLTYQVFILHLHTPLTHP